MPPYSITTNFLDNTDENFRAVELHGLACSTFSQINDISIIFKHEGAGAGGLIFQSSSGDRFFVGLGVEWIGIVPDLQSNETASATLSTFYGQGVRNNADWYTGKPAYIAKDSKGRSIMVDYYVPGGNDLIANIIVFNFSREQSNDCGLATAVQGGADSWRVLKPRMDLHENVDSNTMTATFEFPGVLKQNVQIDVFDDHLNISGESKMSPDHKESGYAVRERQYGKFARSLQLPRGVTDDQIAAKMENGILTVTYPKSTLQTARRKIAIA